MNKIGIKILDKISYEQFESFQYLLDYEFEYDDMESSIKEQKIIELDIDEEDRAEDLEVLHALLLGFDGDEVKYELYLFDGEWERRAFGEIG